MDLFTYLGAKNGKFTLPHKSDLFAYLLGKNSKLPIQTASGMTLEITAKKTNVLELTLDKMCSQDGTPTPDNPIEVNVAEGYRNYFDKDNVTRIYGFIDSNNEWGYSAAAYSFRIACEPNTDYILSANNSSETIFRAGVTDSDSIPDTENVVSMYSVVRKINTNNPITITTGANAKYIVVQFSFANSENSIQSLLVDKGTTLHPYVPYGTNYINLNVTDGVNSINKQIPLNDNFIGGIGNYKDVLTIDESGSISLVKNIGKVVLDGTELNWSKSGNTTFDRFLLGNNIHGIVSAGGYSNYFKMINTNVASNLYELSNNGNSQIVINYSNYGETTLEQFTTWLSTHNTTVYYVVETPTTTSLGNIDISLFKGSNIITNSDNCNMTIKYY